MVIPLMPLSFHLGNTSDIHGYLKVPGSRCLESVDPTSVVLWVQAQKPEMTRRSLNLTHKPTVTLRQEGR
eukprot:symbB.v1.2.004582.t1/scaffold261.1/size248783/10